MLNLADLCGDFSDVGAVRFDLIFAFFSDIGHSGKNASSHSVRIHFVTHIQYVPVCGLRVNCSSNNFGDIIKTDVDSSAPAFLCISMV